MSQKPSNTAAQKRRAELEERRREEAQKREAEAEERGKERLARLAIVRKKEQQRIDENDMRIRHANMLAMARFLSTKAEPKIVSCAYAVGGVPLWADMSYSAINRGK